MVIRIVKRGIGLGLLFVSLVCSSRPTIGDEWGRLQIQKYTPRRDVPRVALRSVDGEKIVLEDFRGKVLFLNFWATWCGWCVREMPSMEKLYKDFKDKGLVILAVDVRESAQKATSFWRRHNLTFPSVLDQSGMASLAFGVRGLPATFLIDRKGRLVGSAPGARDWYSPDAKALISELLAEAGPETKEADGERDVAVEAEADRREVAAEEERGVLFDLSTIAGPPVFSQGQTTVKGTQVFDLDTGKLGDEKTADLSWSEAGLTTRFLIPQNGAEFSNKGVAGEVTFDDIILSRYSSSPINGSEGERNRLIPGTLLYARTNEGRFACLRIDDNGRELHISWVTYEKD